MHKTLLLCFIHGFKGDDDTFGAFPKHMQATLSHALPNVTVRAAVYPRFETRGDLQATVAKFRSWLQDLVIDIEVANNTPSPTVDPSVRVILIGHSMGGIVAADTFLAIASDSPIPPSSSNSASNSTADASQAAPDATDRGRASSPPHLFMFPYIQAVLAFDTPYLGIAPGVVAHGAEAQYQTISKAYSAFSTTASAFGFGGAAASSAASKSSASASAAAAAKSSSSSSSSTALTKIPDKDDGDAAAGPAWQRWGKVAMFAGAAGVAAGGAAAVYFNRDRITSGWGWAQSHLEFVGCLVRSEELRERVRRLIEYSSSEAATTSAVASSSPSNGDGSGDGSGSGGSKGGTGFGFHVLYTQLGAGVVAPPPPPPRGSAEASDFTAEDYAEIAHQPAGKPRTFVRLPSPAAGSGGKASTSAATAAPAKGLEGAARYFSAAVNEQAPDEVAAHTAMFSQRDNPGYRALCGAARALVLRWVDRGWYAGSEAAAAAAAAAGAGGAAGGGGVGGGGEDVEDLEESLESLDGEVPVMVEK